MRQETDRRRRVLEAAVAISRTGGWDALTTRAISQAAGVQPPALYRLFGDMPALIDAVAQDIFQKYVQDKGQHPLSHDPVQDLRDGWDRHVSFGLEHPDVFLHIYADRQLRPMAAELSKLGLDLLHELVGRVAKAGRLAVSDEKAAALMHAGAQGAILSMLHNKGEDGPGRSLSEHLREAIFTSILAPDSAAAPSRETHSVRAHAVGLKVALRSEGAPLSGSERGLLSEWLDRLCE